MPHDCLCLLNFSRPAFVQVKTKDAVLVRVELPGVNEDDVLAKRFGTRVFLYVGSRAADLRGKLNEKLRANRPPTEVWSDALESLEQQPRAELSSFAQYLSAEARNDENFHLPREYYRKTGDWVIVLNDVHETDLARQQSTTNLQHGVLTILVPLAKKEIEQEWF